MTDCHKTLVLMVAGDDPRSFPLLHQIEQLRRRDEIYAWLIRNGITGHKFVEFVSERKGSMLSIRKDILKRLDGVDPGAMIVGKDIA